jgi:hypothetical protein
MPHASTYIKNALLESWGEMSKRQCARRSCWRWVILDLDGGIVANQVGRNLKGSWMMSKREVVALIRLVWEVWCGKVAQINKSLVMQKHAQTYKN